MLYLVMLVPPSCFYERNRLREVVSFQNDQISYRILDAFTLLPLNSPTPTFLPPIKKFESVVRSCPCLSDQFMHLMIRQSLFNLRNGLAGIQVLGTNFSAVHNGVTTI